MRFIAVLEVEVEAADWLEAKDMAQACAGDIDEAAGRLCPKERGKYLSHPRAVRLETALEKVEVEKPFRREG